MKFYPHFDAIYEGGLRFIPKWIWVHIQTLSLYCQCGTGKVP